MVNVPVAALYCSSHTALPASCLVDDSVPTGGTLSEIYEWGPAVRRDELDMLMDKLRYLSRVAQYVVFSGSLPRDVEDDFYAEAIRDLNRRGVQCVAMSIRFSRAAELQVTACGYGRFL